MLRLVRDVGRDTRWIMLSYTLWGVGEGLWLFIQPLYVKSLGASPDQTGFVIGMWGVGRLLFIMPAGVLADRWGSRRLMLPGWYLGLLGVTIMALAPHWRWAVPGFLVYGMSAAAIPVTNVYIAQAIRHDPSRQPDLPIQASLTLLWASYSLGLVVSPSVGGWIGDRLGLRAVYLISILWFVLSALAVSHIRTYPDPVRPAHGHDYRGLLRQGAILAAFGVLTLGFIAVLTGQTLSSQFLADEGGFSRTTIGAFGSLTALGTATLSLSLGRMPAWRGFFLSLLLASISFALLWSADAVPLVAIAVFMLGAHYTTRPMAVSAISGYVAEHQRGVAFALIDTLAGLATVIGTNLSGTLYTRNPGWPFLAGIIGVLGVTVLGLIVRRPSDRRNLDVAGAYSSIERTAE